MIEYKRGDILKEDAEALINTVNCVGVMGRGIALQFKKAFPENFKSYAVACKNDEVQPGLMFVSETGRLTNPRYIINFPTKRHWRGKSRMADIEAGLEALIDTVRQYNILSIAIPPLGSGLGGLDWSEVRPRIEAKLQSLNDVRVIIFEPKGAPATEKMVHNREVPTMTAGRAALVELMNRYLGGLLDPFVTLLEVHKLMYFMQEAGEPLRLKYQKALYGPYAENLRHVLHAIEGHLVSGYADGGDTPGKQLKLVPGAFKDATTFLQQHPDTRVRFGKVAELVEGFESPFGLELLSTVHWIIKNEAVKSVDEAISHTYDWNDSKRQFTPRQIILAADVLSDKGWTEKLKRDGNGEDCVALPGELRRGTETEAFKLTERRVAELSKLADNWNSYEARAPSESVLDFALSFLRDTASVLLDSDIVIPVPFLAPTPLGGVQFEWEVDGRDLELEIPAPHEFCYLQTENDFEREGEANRREAIRLIRWIATGEKI